MESWLSREFFGNSAQSWALAAAAFLFTFTVLPLLRSLIMAQRRRISGPTVPAGVELGLRLITRTSRLFLWAVAVYAAERFLELPPRIDRVSTVLLVLIAWFQVALWGSAAVGFSLDRQQQRAAAEGDASLRGSLGILMFLARVVIFAVAALLALDNLGVNITALVAGLGIGGIALALAVQTVLGDLLASLSITLDKPFTVGDSLRIDDIEGSVERIGIKSTRLRSVSGEQIIVSNADLLKSRVRNLGRMPERRALVNLGVYYDTPSERVDRIPQLVRAVVEAQTGTRFEYCVLRSFAAEALQFELAYFVPGVPARLFLDTVDAVNRGIFTAFEREGLRFSYTPRLPVAVAAVAAPRRDV